MSELTKEALEKDWLFPRQLPTGEWAALQQQMFTTALCVLDGQLSYRTRFCYETLGQALIALGMWDGQDYPPGLWIKQKPEDLLNPEWARAHPDQAIDVKLAPERKVTTTVDVSHVAICDSCNEHYYADSTEEGGWLFGRHADCPKCATPEREKRIEGYNEQHLITDRARPGETYFNFVMRVRDGNHSIRVTAPADDPMHDIVRENASRKPE